MVLAIIGGVLLIAGGAAVLVGVLPVDQVQVLAARTVPVLGFVVAVTVVAELAARAGVFAWIAGGAARAARGRGLVLWLLVVLIAVVSTVFLSLDTTAVLLTPIVVAVAARARLPILPFAMTTVWLANTASLLLPVSNLTNLIAESGPGLVGRPFTPLIAAPALVAVVVPVALLLLLHRRSIVQPFQALPADAAEDLPLRRVATAVLVLLVPLLVSGLPVWIPATAAALALVVVFAVRAPRALQWRLVPWQLVVLVSGLFLAVTAAGRLGLTPAVRAVAGEGSDPLALLRLAGAAAVAANAVDNLPAYLALEPVAHTPARAIALLVGVNAGPLITPWASLATLLWHRQLVRGGHHVPWRHFVLAGLVAAPATVVLAALAIPR